MKDKKNKKDKNIKKEMKIKLKKNFQSPFSLFLERITAEEREAVRAFFEDFDLNFLVSKNECRKFRQDFEAAILYLYDSGTPLSEVLARLSLDHLGGFYARPSVTWFPLDDAAKILVYDEETMELVTEKVMNPLGGPGKYECEKKSIRKMLPYGEDKLVVFIDDEAHLLDGETLEILQTAQLPDMTEVATIAADNTVYFAVDEKLYRILFD